MLRYTEMESDVYLFSSFMKTMYKNTFGRVPVEWRRGVAEFLLWSVRSDATPAAGLLTER